MRDLGGQSVDPAFAEELFRQFFGGGSARNPFGFGSSAAGQSGADDFSAESIFRQAGGQAAAQNLPPFGRRNGSDIMTRLSIAFMDAIKGTKRTIRYTADTKCSQCSGSGLKPGVRMSQCSTCGGSGEQFMQQGPFRIMMTCQTCGGQGSSVRREDYCGQCRGHGTVSERIETTVNIPAGVDTGERLRVSGKGNAGVRGRAGDLFIQVEVESPSSSKNESIFKRRGSDLTVEVPVAFYDAILGTELGVPTIDGPFVRIRLPPGTQPGYRTVIRGQGVQKLMKSSGVRGDLYVEVKVKIPDLSSGDNREALKKLIEDFKRVSQAKSQEPSGAPHHDKEEEEEGGGEDKGFLQKTLDKIKDRLACENEKDDNNKPKKKGDNGAQ